MQEAIERVFNKKENQPKRLKQQGKKKERKANKKEESDEEHYNRSDEETFGSFLTFDFDNPPSQDPYPTTTLKDLTY